MDYFGKFVLRLSFLIAPFTGPFSAYANITFSPHRAPTPAEEWIDTDSTSHNHNTYIQFNMENIRKQPIKQYDAYGSWYFLENQSPSSMDFHYSSTDSGMDHKDSIHFGHGFIPSVRPIIYEYVNVPSNQIDIIDMAFKEWNTQINKNPSVFRKPGTIVGFNWKQKTDELLSDIKVFWKDVKNTQLGAFFTPSTQEITFDSTPELFKFPEYWSDINGNSIFDPMIDSFVDNNGNGMFDANINLKIDWHLPITGQVDIYNYDLYTTALHEIGHAVGLDELYNLCAKGPGLTGLGCTSEPGDALGRFPDSLMGSGTWPYWLQDYVVTGMPALVGPRQLPMRRIDLGSVQGGVDLYTIPVPGPIPFMGLAIAFGYSRKLRYHITISTRKK